MAFFNTNQAQEKSIMEFVNILILYGIDTDILISKRDEYLNNMTSKINFNIQLCKSSPYLRSGTTIGTNFNL